MAICIHSVVGLHDFIVRLLASMLDLKIPESTLKFCKDRDKERARKSEHDKRPAVKRRRSKGAKRKQAQRIIDDKAAKASSTYYQSGIKFADNSGEGTSGTANQRKKRKASTCSACNEAGHRKDNKRKCRAHPDYVGEERTQQVLNATREGTFVKFWSRTCFGSCGTLFALVKNVYALYTYILSFIQSECTTEDTESNIPADESSKETEDSFLVIRSEIEILEGAISDDN